MKKSASVYLLYLFCFFLLLSCHTRKPTTAIASNKHASSTHEKLWILEKEVNKWLGVPYRFGGNNKQGIDCSGFVCAIYQLVYNLKIPRTTKDQFQRINKKERHDLKAGDLVFFAIQSNSINHVGIFLRPNQFAHASVSKGVVISDLSNKYYSKYYVSGGEVLK